MKVGSTPSELGTLGFAHETTENCGSQRRMNFPKGWCSGSELRTKGGHLRPNDLSKLTGPSVVPIKAAESTVPRRRSSCQSAALRAPTSCTRKRSLTRNKCVFMMYARFVNAIAVHRIPDSAQPNKLEIDPAT